MFEKVLSGDDDIDDLLHDMPQEAKERLKKMARIKRAADNGEIDPFEAAREVLRLVGLDLESLIYGLIEQYTGG